MLRALPYRCLNLWDNAYRRCHRLQAVGPMLYIGSVRYTAAVRRFADGTVLAPGDRLGTLHLNNARIATLDDRRGRHLTAWQFARLLRDSLRALATFSLTPAGASFKVYHGTTWMRPHGLAVGFSGKALPSGWRARLLRLHFRVLRAGFSPVGFRTVAADPEPRHFWITRTELHRYFGAPRT